MLKMLAADRPRCRCRRIPTRRPRPAGTPRSPACRPERACTPTRTRSRNCSSRSRTSTRSAASGIPSIVGGRAGLATGRRISTPMVAAAPHRQLRDPARGAATGCCCAGRRRPGRDGGGGGRGGPGARPGLHGRPRRALPVRHGRRGRGCCAIGSSCAPDEAIWMPAGNLHAYLRGTGMEVLAASDNVLRGGFTAKRVDVDELMRVLLSTCSPTRWSSRSRCSRRWSRGRYRCRDFSLVRAAVTPPDGPVESRRARSADRLLPARCGDGRRRRRDRRWPAAGRRSGTAGRPLIDQRRWCGVRRIHRPTITLE